MSSFHADLTADKQERPAVAFRRDSNYLPVHGKPKVTFGSVDQPNQIPRSTRQGHSQPGLYSGGKPQQIKAYITFGTAVVPEQPPEHLPAHEHHHHHRVPHGPVAAPSPCAPPPNPPERSLHDFANAGAAGLPPSNAAPRPPRVNQDQHPRPQHPLHGPGMGAPMSVALPHQTMLHSLPPASHSVLAGHQIPTQAGRLPPGTGVPPMMQQCIRPMIPAPWRAPGQFHSMVHSGYAYMFHPQHPQQPYHAPPRPPMGSTPAGTPYMAQATMYAPAGVGHHPALQSFNQPQYPPVSSPASQQKSTLDIVPAKSTVITITDPNSGETVSFARNNATVQQQPSPAEQVSPHSAVAPTAHDGLKQSKAIEIEKPLKEKAGPALSNSVVEEEPPMPTSTSPPAAIALTVPEATMADKKLEPAPSVPEVKKAGDTRRDPSPSRPVPSPSPWERSSPNPVSSRRVPSPGRPAAQSAKPDDDHASHAESALRTDPAALDPATDTEARPTKSEAKINGKPEPNPDGTMPSDKTEKRTPSAKPDEAMPADKTEENAPSAKPDETAPADKAEKKTPSTKPDVTTPADNTEKKASSAKPAETTPADKTAKKTPSAKPDETMPAGNTDKKTPSAKPAERAVEGPVQRINVGGEPALNPIAGKDEDKEAKASKKASGENDQVVDIAKPEERADELEKAKIRDDRALPACSASPPKEKRPAVTRKEAPANIDVARAQAGKLKKLESFEGVARVEGNIISGTPGEDNRRYRYDRDFLLHFMNICKDKPDGLKPTDAVAGVDSGPPRMQLGAGSKTPVGIVRAASGSSRLSATFGTGQMGNFQAPASKTSEQRFAESSRALSARSLPRASSSSNLLPPTTMSGSFGRSDDRRRGGPSGRMRDDRRTPSTPRIPHSPAPSGFTIPPNQVAPLEKTENRWVARFADVNPHSELTQEMLEKKVKGLLNKLTIEKFDRIAPQIMDFANRSENEKDGRSLTTVIRLIFEKATDEPAFSAMYAQLCQTMQEKLSPHIIDLNVQKDGRPITGGNLFRKHLLNRCQEEFEKGWKVESENDGKPKSKPLAPGSEILTDEYYAAQKKKRRGLGLIRFIGELFKLQMLTERIMHECVRRLLQDPEEEETESLCKLLATVGKQVDHEKAQQYMNFYFQQMEGLAKNEELPSRIRYMVKDVIELRKNKWVPRQDASGPKTIAQIHQDAERQKLEAAAATAEVLRRAQSSGGRGMPGIGKQIRKDSKDGWQVAGGAPKRVDTTNFGKLSHIGGSRGGCPGGVFAAGGSKGWKADKEEIPPLSRRSSNAFSLLQADSDHTTRSRVSVDAQAEPAKVEASSGKGSPARPVKKTPEVERKIIDSMMKEFWGVHDVKVVVDIIKDDIGNPNAHIGIVRGFVEQVLEKKEHDVQALASVFSALVKGGVVTHAQIRDAFVDVVPVLQDTVCDAPKAPKFFKRLIEAARLPADDVKTVLAAFTDDIVKAAVA